MSATASPSPLYASPLSSVGYSTELPAGYVIERSGYGVPGYDVHHVTMGLIDDEFDSYAAACFAAQDHAAAMATAAAVEAALEAQIDADNAAIDAERAALSQKAA